MNSPCKTAVTCPCDNLAGAGYSSEAGDQVFYMDTQFAAVIPALGNSSYTRLACQSTQTSPVSLAAADLQAQQEALLCAEGLASPYNPDTFPLGGQGGAGGGGSPNLSPGGGGSGGNSGAGGGGGSGGSPSPGGGGSPPGPSTFFNTAQTVTLQCPDGTPFSYTAAAGLFSGNTQLIADTAAITYANQQVALRIVCLGNLANTSPIVGQTYTGVITATGGQLAIAPNTNQWILSGGLPDGLVFQPNTPAPNQATITGVPLTALQDAVFTVTITDPNNNTQSKQYSLLTGCTTSHKLIENFEYSQSTQPFQLTTYPDCPNCGSYIARNWGFGDFVRLTITFTGPTNYIVSFKFFGSGCQNYPGIPGCGYYQINGAQTNVTAAPDPVGSFNTGDIHVPLSCGGVTIQIFAINGSPTCSCEFDFNSFPA